MKHRVSQLVLIVFVVAAILVLAVVTLDRQTQAQERSANHLRASVPYHTFPVTKGTLCSSVYTLTNQSSEVANMVHEFFDGYGDAGYTFADSIAVDMFEVYDLRSMDGLPYGYNGDAIVSADQPFTYTLQLVCLAPTPTPTPTGTPTPVPTPMPQTSIHVYTDKASYTTGETMHVGLDMTTARTATAESYWLLILLQTPSTGVVVASIPALPLPPDWTYSNSDLLSFRLPSLERGTYSWIGMLIPAGESPAVDSAIWEFTGSDTLGKMIVPVEKALRRLGEVDLSLAK